MGLPLSDIDIATTATPEEVMRRAAAAGLKAVPTGIDHGTITLVVEGVPFEVTTLREDVETFGRKAIVAFGRDWQVDAERRDFTMNALSISPDGTVHDYVGGLADLRERRVRFIGDPARRIAEDYLRILRFFRFQASYAHGAPDPAGLHACIVARDGLRTLSRERVRGELMKLLLAPFAVPTLAVMAETGFAERLLGGVPQLASFANMIKVEAATAQAPDAARRLGALALLVVEDADRLRDRLRLANAEHERLLAMARGVVAVVPRPWRCARLALSAGTGPFPRPRPAGVVALAGRRRRSVMARAGGPAGAMDAAALSAPGGGPGVARHPQRPGARRCAGGRRGSLDRRGFSVRPGDVGQDRRPRGRPAVIPSAIESAINPPLPACRSRSSR